MFVVVAFLAVFSMKASQTRKDSEWHNQASMEEEQVHLANNTKDNKKGKIIKRAKGAKKGNRKDFKNRAEPLAKGEWSRIDNLNCYTKEKGAGSDLEEWQRRAPYALIIGAMKAGTTSLNKYLEQHSLVVKSRRKELHFYDFSFDDFASEEGILRRSARAGYAALYRQFMEVNELEEMPDKVALDDSPRYLFWTDRVPARVLCVTPWVKILAILRNPIDRAFSQFNMFLTKKPVGLTFERWIEQDMHDLRETGVIQATIPLSEFSGSDAEAAAWKAYTRLGTHAPIGRGLYALQLRHWFNTFNEAGKSLEDVLVIQSELMKEDPDLVYKDIIEFLGLPDEPLQNDEGRLVGDYKIELSPHTSGRLQDFYAPYNQELYDLLGENWMGVWDP